MNCPCGSPKKYERCCGIFHRGELPQTAEQLMRSRYSAFATKNEDYLIATLHPAFQDPSSDRLELRESFESCQWLKLEIISTQAGGENDAFGTVEFKASYRAEGRKQVHHEVSTFEKIGGRWYYKEPIN